MEAPLHSCGASIQAKLPHFGMIRRKSPSQLGEWMSTLAGLYFRPEELFLRARVRCRSMSAAEQLPPFTSACRAICPIRNNSLL